MVKLLMLLLIGFVISVGWHFGKILGFIASDIVEARVKSTKWYNDMKRPKGSAKMTNKKPSSPYSGTTIGFCAKREDL